MGKEKEKKNTGLTDIIQISARIPGQGLVFSVILCLSGRFDCPPVQRSDRAELYRCNLGYTHEISSVQLGTAEFRTATAFSLPFSAQELRGVLDGSLM